MLTGFAASAAMAVAPMQAITETRLRESIEVAERERARWARELPTRRCRAWGRSGYAWRPPSATAARSGWTRPFARR